MKLSREDKIALYDKLVKTLPGVTLKGDTIPYTSLNGNMYSYLSKEDELALRLPANERAPFIEKYNTTLMFAYGIVQKEYVIVPDSLLQNADDVMHYFKLSYAYVNSLKPKPTKGKNKS